jgi:hypothetical protein
MSKNSKRDDQIVNRLIGIYLQLKEYYTVKDKGGNKDDLDMRCSMLRKSVERLEDSLSPDKDNIIEMPKH